MVVNRETCVTAQQLPREGGSRNHGNLPLPKMDGDARTRHHCVSMRPKTCGNTRHLPYLCACQSRFAKTTKKTSVSNRRLTTPQTALLHARLPSSETTVHTCIYQSPSHSLHNPMSHVYWRKIRSRVGVPIARQTCEVDLELVHIRLHLTDAVCAANHCKHAYRLQHEPQHEKRKIRVTHAVAVPHVFQSVAL